MTEPLIKVLKVVDQDKKPTLGVIYDCMDRAKTDIKVSCKSWNEIGPIIDKKWKTQLHRDLHAAANFLNPTCQYNENFNDDEKVRKSLKAVIKHIEPDVAIQAKALDEVQLFKEAKGEFGDVLAKKSRTTCLPAQWWYNYGESAPNLRRIAIKVLSQTCSSSGCERNWSTFALIHTKIRNRIAMQKLEQLVYVHYNLRLRVRQLLTRKEDDDNYNPIDPNHIFTDEDILDSWIREFEEPLLSPTDKWLQEGIQELSGDDDHKNEIGGSSCSRGRGRSGSVEPPTSERARDAWDSQTSREKEVYQGNSEEENPGSGSESSDSGSESSDSGGEGGGGGGEFSGGGDDGELDEYDGRGGGSYSDSTQVETQTWQKGRIIDSTDQTRHVNEGDWQEEVYQKIKIMQENYWPELNEIYQKMVTKIQQHDSLPQQPKTDRLEKLKILKTMLERVMAFLQVPKNGVSANFKEKLGLYEKQIINFRNFKKSRVADYLLQQGELPPPHMHSIQHSQQAQSQIHQVQPHENQTNPQLQPRNLQGSVATMQQNNMTSLQDGSLTSLSGVSNAQLNMMNSLPPGSNLDSGISNDLSAWLLNLNAYF